MYSVETTVGKIPPSSPEWRGLAERNSHESVPAPRRNTKPTMNNSRPIVAAVAIHISVIAARWVVFGERIGGIQLTVVASGLTVPRVGTLRLAARTRPAMAFKLRLTTNSTIPVAKRARAWSPLA